MLMVHLPIWSIYHGQFRNAQYGQYTMVNLQIPNVCSENCIKTRLAGQGQKVYTLN